MRLQAYVVRKGLDQPALPRSVIRIFTVRQQNHWLQQDERIEGKSLDSTLYFAHSQDDLILRILRMLEGNFYFDAAQIYGVSGESYTCIFANED